MKNTVGVRELRQNLSQYLRRVEQGETLEVLERGRPVAILAPLPERRGALERLLLGEFDGLVSSALAAVEVSRAVLRATPEAAILHRARQVLAEQAAGWPALGHQLRQVVGETGGGVAGSGCLRGCDTVHICEPPTRQLDC